MTHSNRNLLEPTATDNSANRQQRQSTTYWRATTLDHRSPENLTPRHLPSLQGLSETLEQKPPCNSKNRKATIEQLSQETRRSTVQAT
jgi:hypothetical protein